MHPQLLVVMPVYNAALYVIQAVDSILSQSFKDFCLLVIEDESTDNSSELIRNFDDPRIQVRFQAHSGPGIAMNSALSFALEKGIPFIARMDADDIAEPERLARQIAVLNTNPKCAACSSNCYYIDEKGMIIGSSTVPVSPMVIRWEIQHGFRGLIQGATLFRSDALASIGGYRPQFRLAEEVDLFLRLLEKYELGNSSEFLYKIRLHNNSLSMKDVRLNVNYQLYALHCAKQRKNRKVEQDYIKYEWNQTLIQKAKLAQECLILNLWRESFSKKSLASAVIAAALDPMRVLARTIRFIEYQLLSIKNRIG